MLIHAAVLESIMAQTTVDYLERRYAALEKEIENALHQSPIDDLAIADLKSRKLIVADEIQHNRRLVERFGKLGAHSRLRARATGRLGPLVPFGRLSAEARSPQGKMPGLPLTTAANAAKLCCKPLISLVGAP
jgi:hypothetical protein